MCEMLPFNNVVVLFADGNSYKISGFYWFLDTSYYEVDEDFRITSAVDKSGKVYSISDIEIIGYDDWYVIETLRQLLFKDPNKETL